MRTVRTVLSLAVILILAGCTNSRDDAKWVTPSIPDSLPLADTIALPFDSYRLGDADRIQLQTGTARLLQQCISKYQLTVAFAGDYIQQKMQGQRISFQWGGRLGTLKLDQARTYGYTAPEGATWMNGNGFYLSDPSNIFPLVSGNGITDAQILGAIYGPDRAIFFGPSGEKETLSAEQMPKDASGKPPEAGGCFKEVEGRIGAPAVDTSTLTRDAYRLAFNTAAVQKVSKTWSDCMNAAGYQYERFDAAASENAGAPTSENIAIAVADVTCTESSRWPNTFYYVLADYQRQTIEKNSEIFEAALKTERRRLEVVNSLLR